MSDSRRDRIITEINRLLLENELSGEDREAIVESIIISILDDMEDIEDIDAFQDRINDMVDDYVEENFEEGMGDSIN